jgi:hypothetical protein
MTETLVESLATSSSWENSRRLMALLDTVPSLTPIQIARLLTATEENIDVKNALMGNSTVPKRIHTLAKRLS